MKKLLTLALAIMLAATSLFVLGCDGNSQTSEMVVGKYCFYAMSDYEIDEQNNTYHGVLKKVGDEYDNASGAWTLSKESIVLEIFSDNTFKLKEIYGQYGNEYVHEGIWIKDIDESFENQYYLKVNANYGNDTAIVYLSGNELVAINNAYSLFKYNENIILQKQ